MIQTLNAFIESRRHLPFQWGVNDCCMFAADWALVATGLDPALAWRNTYQSAIGANRLLLDHGGVVSFADRALKSSGWGATPPPKAQRGSIAALGPLDAPTLGVVIHPGVVAPGASGLVFFPHTDIIHAWSFK